MRFKTVYKCGTRRLILIYAGWGMDWRPFARLRHPGYDIMVVWDYRELTFNWAKVLSAYDEICLIAWSIGVFAASVTIHEILPRITMRLAVNGTLNPIDDRRGIPPAIWHGTQMSLTPSTWRTFQRRICTSEQQYEQFRDQAPRRTIADLAEELTALETHTLFHAEQVTAWDMAIVSLSDGIFPPANQKRAWVDSTTVRTLDGGHLPDFSKLIHRLIIDKERVSDRYGSIGSSYEANSGVQQHIADELMRHFNRLFGKGPIVGNIIEIGPGYGGCLTQKWIDRTDPRAKLMLWDIADINTDKFAPGTVFERCDAEVRIKRQASASAGFIFSSSTVQWFNSPREFIKECDRVLVPGGYLVLSSFVQGNLEEVNSVMGNGLQLPTLRGWRNMLPHDMTLPVCDSDMVRLQFDSPRAVLEHLRDTGANAVSYDTEPVSAALQLLRNYPVSDDGRYMLTYRPVYIIMRKNSDPEAAN